MALYPPLLHRVDALNWTLYRFEIPYVTKGLRQGLLICTKNDKNEERWAEVSPLPGRSIETLEEAQKQLLDYFSGAPKTELFPSVQFGLEALFSPLQLPLSASLYALLSGSPQEVLQRAEAAALQGYQTVKVKVSSFSIQTAKEILQQLQGQFHLRVDCNRAFSLKQACALFSDFDPSVFEYIEDPTYETEHLSSFTHPFALDETVLQYLKFPPEKYPHLYGLILKPSLLGGKKGCSPLIDYAKKHHLKVVFSPLFESTIGLLYIASLANELGFGQEPIGLDTHRYLKEDLLVSSMDFNTPKLIVDQLPTVNLQRLTKIAHGTHIMPTL